MQRNRKDRLSEIHIPPSYPVTPPGGVFLHPAVLRSDGGVIRADECTEPIDGKVFQRWSGHYLPGSRHPNEEHPAAQVLVCRDWLDRAASSEMPL